MESINQEEDRISALPDDILLHILECLDMRSAIRAGVVSSRWRHLPHRLSRLLMEVCDVRSASCVTLREIMEAYTDATRKLLSTCGECGSRSIKSMFLSFYLTDPFLCSIGRDVGYVVKKGETKCLEFAICPHLTRPTSAQLDLFGRRFMSFFLACPVAFRWLTTITLDNLAFRDSDVPNFLNGCHKLQSLSLRNCQLSQKKSVLKINAPCSELQTLQFLSFGCTRIELISVPKLRHVLCHSWCGESSPFCFGYVPQLQEVRLISRALSWQKPFALSKCLSSTSNLSVLCLSFCCQMIWIRPEDPKQLMPMFSNLSDVCLFNIFAECDLNWTLFILQAAPSLKNFYLSRHSCVINKTENIAEKTNLVWKPCNFKHLNLKLLYMKGFEEEEKVMNYIRLVMEHAVGLKKIELRDKIPCSKCEAINPEPPRFLVDEDSKRRIREQLTYGLSSPEIIIGCWIQSRNNLER